MYNLDNHPDEEETYWHGILSEGIKGMRDAHVEKMIED